MVIESIVNDARTKTVISIEFAGKRPLQRHQMIYAALGDKMGSDIHALTIQALTPEESASRGG